MKTVVVLGKGWQAIRTASWFKVAEDYELVAVVPVTPEPAWSASFKAWSNGQGIPVIVGHAGVSGADLAVSVFYDRILDAEWIGRFGRVLNLHNAPLPRYRGVNPINWALRNNEKSHGVTLHEVTPGIDDGPVVAQVTFPIWPETDEVSDVYARCLAFGWTLMEQTLPLLDRIVAVPQDHAHASYYSKGMVDQLGDRQGWRRP